MKRIAITQILVLCGFLVQSQHAISYELNAEFFPENAQMWGYPVSNLAFMKGDATIVLSDTESNQAVFMLHGELKIDSLISGGEKITYNSEQVFYEEDYSLIGLKTTFNYSDLSADKILQVYYSGFINPSRARSLSDYFYINKYEGVYLRGYYYTPWFPVFEKPDLEDYLVNFKSVRVKLPKPFKAVLSGELIHESEDDTFYVTTWRPGLTSLSSIQCTARKFNLLADQNVLVHFVNDQNSAEGIKAFTANLQNLYVSTFKTVEGSKVLNIVEMPEYGDISSQNMIGVSTAVYENFDNEIYSKLTIAHELVHPYVSIPVAKSNELYALVIEGFPSFFHLYALHKLLDQDEFSFPAYMKRIETSYLTKKQSGKDRRGNPLPAEKPIVEINPSEIGEYKDLFILSDRVRLFLYHIWSNMGDQNFDKFLKELFTMDALDYQKFESLILAYLPDYKKNLSMWLKTNDYPAILQIKR